MVKKILVKNDPQYWEFIRKLRNMDGVRQGFVNQQEIKPVEQARYMLKHNNNYWICLVGERLNDQSIIINREVPIESPDVVYSSARESHAQCCCLVPALHINITVRESKWRMADVHNSRIARKIQVPVVLAWNLSTV